MHVYVYLNRSIYYAHLPFARFESCVCCGSLMTTYLYQQIPLHIHDLLRKINLKH